VTFLVDANVLSETTKPEPNAKLVSWLRAHEEDIVVDPIVLGEILYGILLLPKGKRRQKLEAWFSRGVTSLVCLPWDAAVGQRWAELLAQLRKSGKTMSVKDSMIAATALTHDLTLVTRNERDFRNAGLKVLNPFGR
jgi:predicted nucleic acid-binding protein